jgi:hypothetical protein
MRTFHLRNKWRITCPFGTNYNIWSLLGWDLQPPKQIRFALIKGDILHTYLVTKKYAWLGLGTTCHRIIFLKAIITFTKVEFSKESSRVGCSITPTSMSTTRLQEPTMSKVCNWVQLCYHKVTMSKVPNWEWLCYHKLRMSKVPNWVQFCY